MIAALSIGLVARGASSEEPPTAPTTLNTPSAHAPADPSASSPSTASGSVTGSASAAASPDESDPPSDLSVSITRDPDGRSSLVVRRPGHLILLRAGDLRASGQGTVTLVLDKEAPAGELRTSGQGATTTTTLVLDKDARAAGAIVRWETSDLSSLAAARGLVRIAPGDGDALTASASLIDAPEPVATLNGASHRCAALRDASAGFSVVCRFKAGAWRIGAANITSDDPHRGVWVMPSGPAGASHVDPTTGIPTWDTFVSLDLPLARGAAVGSVASYLMGATGHVIRAEATWLPGEEPSILLTEASKLQPFDFAPKRPFPRGADPFMVPDFL